MKTTPVIKHCVCMIDPGRCARCHMYDVCTKVICLLGYK